MPCTSRSGASAGRGGERRSDAPHSRQRLRDAELSTPQAMQNVSTAAGTGPVAGTMAGGGAGRGADGWSGMPQSRQRLRAAGFNAPQSAQRIPGSGGTVTIPETVGGKGRSDEPHSRQRLRAMEFSTPHDAQNVSDSAGTGGHRMKEVRAATSLALPNFTRTREAGFRGIASQRGAWRPPATCVRAASNASATVPAVARNRLDRKERPPGAGGERRNCVPAGIDRAERHDASGGFPVIHPATFTPCPGGASRES